MRECEGHGGQPLRGRKDDDHRVRQPRLAGQSVPDTAPEIDDWLAVQIGSAGAAELVATREVVGEGPAYRLEAWAHMSADADVFRCCDRHAPVGRNGRT